MRLGAVGEELAPRVANAKRRQGTPPTLAAIVSVKGRI